MHKINMSSRIFSLILVAVVLMTFAVSSFNLRTLIDALFLEGAALLSIGAILTAGLPKLSLLKFIRERAAQSQEPEAPQEEESRGRNARIGVVLMLAGFVLIVLCIGLGELILR